MNGLAKQKAIDEWKTLLLLVYSSSKSDFFPFIFKASEVDRNDLDGEKYEISESMRLEMEYNNDRAW